jgi:quercetin dioxygenase-like cupin family protein
VPETANRQPVTDIGTELLFENAAVRVWSMELAPGEDSPYHVHANDYLFVYTTPSRIAFVEPTGRVGETREYGDGFVNYITVGSGLTHQIRNVAAAPHRQILVEFKTLKDVAPTANNGRQSGPL